VIVDGDEGPRSQLLTIDGAFARIPSLAIHLQRGINTEGLVLNPQRHLPAIAALTVERDEPSFAAWLAATLGKNEHPIAPEAILGWDLGLHDSQPATRAGRGGELLAAPRLDNLASCHAAITSLLDHDEAGDATKAIVLFDHEEVGSRSAQGAASSFLTATLERLSQALEPERTDALRRALARSFFLSVDMAHASHPNHVDRHEPQHRPELGGGPVLKMHTSQSYATDAEGWARFERCARSVEVPTQRFVVRTDMACGSTIGPITAAQLGIPTADIGNPMLAMHAARETAAASDVDAMIRVLGAFLAS
jgi:aspartyl aminopeptidase